MIIPGLDRLDGTAVSGELGDGDWHEHTTELLALLEAENAGRNPADCVSMVAFCLPFAQGARTTRAMRRVSCRKEWRTEALATRLAEDRRCVLLVVGAAFAYDAQDNSEAREAMGRMREVLVEEGLSPTPMNALHVTVGVWRPRAAANAAPLPRDPLERIEREVRANVELQRQAARAPFHLRVDDIRVGEDGAVTLQFRVDDEGGRRILELRKAVGGRAAATKDWGGFSAPNMVVHCTIARVLSEVTLPCVSKAELVRKLRTACCGDAPEFALRLAVKTMDLVAEEHAPFLGGFPEGCLAHWDFGATARHANREGNSEPYFLDLQVRLVLVASVAALVVAAIGVFIAR